MEYTKWRYVPSNSPDIRNMHKKIATPKIEGLSLKDTYEKLTSEISNVPLRPNSQAALDDLLMNNGEIYLLGIEAKTGSKWHHIGHIERV